MANKFTFPHIDIPSAPSWAAKMAPAVAAVGFVLVIVCLVVASRSGSASDESEADVNVETTQPVVISYEPSIASIDSVPASGESLSAFTLITEGESYTPTLSEEDQSAITTALEAFANSGYDAAFVLVNLDSGAGYCYNMDTDFYGASTIKGPILIYGCQQALEQGSGSLSAVESYAERAIIESHNTSY